MANKCPSASRCHETYGVNLLRRRGLLERKQDHMEDSHFCFLRYFAGKVKELGKKNEFREYYWTEGVAKE